MSLHTLAACAALALPACGTAPTPPDTTVAAGTYRFDRPAARFEMPEALREISALTVLDDGHVGAVQDEEGALYVIETETGRVSAIVPFGPPGDYEGIELAAGRLFVLRADGAVLEISGWTGASATATVYETGLGAKQCDAEGLGTDGAQLLIACKEESGGQNLVYGFHLDTDALTEAPVLALDPDAVPGEKGLRPSAIAVHPVTGHTVVLSSRREALISLNASGAVVDVWDLKPAAFEQPEGLAFLPNGDVLVSSEGKKGPGVVVRVTYEATR